MPSILNEDLVQSVHVNHKIKVRRLLRLAAALALALAWGLYAPVGHATEIEARGTSVQYYTDVDIKEVGDVEGHVTGTYETNGVTLREDGEISTSTAKGAFDQINGEGTQKGLIFGTFDDGSTLVTQFQGRIQNSDDGRRGKGTFSCQEGTGRFEGVECDGVYTSRYLDNDMTVTEWQGTFHLPTPDRTPNEERR